MENLQEMIAGYCQKFDAANDFLLTQRLRTTLSPIFPALLHEFFRYKIDFSFQPQFSFDSILFK